MSATKGRHGVRQVQQRQAESQLQSKLVPCVSKMSVRLKNSLSVSELSHEAGQELQSTPGWLMLRVAPWQGLWPIQRFVASGTFLIL